MSSVVTNASVPKNQLTATLRRFAPLAVIAAAIGSAFALGVGDYLSFEALRDNRLALLQALSDLFLQVADISLLQG